MIALGKLIDYYDTEEEAYSPKGKKKKYPKTKKTKQHDIDYSKAKNLRDKWKADAKMIKSIESLPGSKTMTERIVRRIMQAKRRLKL